MAAAGFFAIFDDIATLLDDAATMSKVAAKKTAGVLGDDLAVGAERASGYPAARELPVLWAISKGSLINKLIILPAAFVLSAFAPWSIIPILMLGGLYLAYEGAEKVYEFFVPHKQTLQQVKQLADEQLMSYEAKKVKAAIVTDFILSIEIIIIAMSTVLEHALVVQVLVVSLIALLATIGVYGVVALLVRLDDMGFWLIQQAANDSSLLAAIGHLMVKALPRLISLLSVVGTLAMFLVAGGIYVHNIPALHEFLHILPDMLAQLLTGLVIGAVIVFFVKLPGLFRSSEQH